MDILLEELDRKEYELAEMKQENEDCLEYENMVEEMTHEILRKEDEVKQWEAKFKSSEETIAIQEHYTESLEQLNQELTEETAELKAELAQIELQRSEDEELMVDLDDENQKYREKVAQLNKNIKELTIQLEQQAGSDEEKSKVQVLVDTQNQLQVKVKEGERRELDSQVRKIDYHWQQAVKQRVIENIIPPRLQESVHFDSLDRLNLLNKSVNRALLMLRYICEKQMPNVQNQYGASGTDAASPDEDEELSLKLRFVKLLITLAQ